jgi:hypothetical protein
MKFTALLTVVSLVLLPSLAAAEVPGLMSYQGTLTDPGGAALDTTVDMTFGIYTDSTGGSLIWSETQLAVIVGSGVFNVLLGRVNSIPDTVFNNQERWLSLQVGSDPELDPRQRIAAVGYALRAAESDTADYARSATGASGGWVDAGTTIRLETDTDSVGIGMASPSEKLHVDGSIRIENDYLIGSSTVLSIAGTENTLVGVDAGAGDTGDYGTFVGHSTGQVNQGSFNTFLGQTAGASNTTGLKNTFLGQGAGYNNVTGFENTFLGQVTGVSNVTGSCNTFLGKSAGYNNTVGDSNVFIGYKAGYTETGSGKLYIDNSSTASPLIYGEFDHDLLSINGDVGIGTISPASRLHVNGAIRLGAGSRHFQLQQVHPSDPQGWADLIDYGGIGIGSEDGTNRQMFMFTDGAGSQDILTVATSEDYGSSWQGDFVIQQNGHVGIGTLSPAKHLHVDGSARVSDTLFVDGRVGIGTTSPQAKLHAYTTFTADEGVYGEASVGIHGKGYSGFPGSPGIGVKGETPDGNTNGRLGYYFGAPSYRSAGVYGYTAGVDDYAGKFDGKVAMHYFQMTTSPSDGYVLTSDASGNGSWQPPAGIDLPYSDTDSSDGTLFLIANNDSGAAIRGESNQGTYHTGGVIGTLRDGILCYTEDHVGAAIYALSIGMGYAQYALNEVRELHAYLAGTAAVYAENAADSLYCRLSDLQYAMHAWGTDILETVAKIGGGLWVVGDLTKGKSITTIDHPLDPENMLLSHASMESPEALAVYRGKARLSASGEAIVQMPDYFAAFTKENEATVTLTPVGRPFLTGYDWQSGHRDFKIYGEASREVSWVVYAERDDPYTRMSRYQVEEHKGPGTICDRGKFLHPEAYGYPRNMSFDYQERQQAIEEASPERMKRDIELLQVAR